MDGENKEKGLKNTTIGLMTGVALFYDALQALFAWMGLGWLIIPIAYGHFWLWFRFHSVKFFTPKRAPSVGIGVALEAVTAGVIPSITFNVLRCALDYKIRKAVPISGIIK